MKEVTFNYISLEEVDDNINVIDLYYKKLKNIYGNNFYSLLSKLFPNDSKNDKDENYNKALKIVDEIKNHEYDFMTIALDDLVIGFLRIINKDYYFIVPEIIFLKYLNSEQEAFIINQLMKYLESTLDKKIFFEIPCKNEDLIFMLLNQDYVLVEEDFSETTFLMTHSTLNRVLK